MHPTWVFFYKLRICSYLLNVYYGFSPWLFILSLSSLTHLLHLSFFPKRLQFALGLINTQFWCLWCSPFYPKLMSTWRDPLSFPRFTQLPFQRLSCSKPLTCSLQCSLTAHLASYFSEKINVSRRENFCQLSDMTHGLHASTTSPVKTDMPCGFLTAACLSSCLTDPSGPSLTFL